MRKQLIYVTMGFVLLAGGLSGLHSKMLTEAAEPETSLAPGYDGCPIPSLEPTRVPTPGDDGCSIPSLEPTQIPAPGDDGCPIPSLEPTQIPTSEPTQIPAPGDDGCVPPFLVSASPAPGCDGPPPTPSPKPYADYADIYIQALEKCGYTDGKTLKREYVAVDFDTSVKSSKDPKEAVRAYLEEKGYSVKIASISELMKQGYVNRNSKLDWSLPNGEFVSFYVDGYEGSDTMDITCSIRHNSRAQHSYILTFHKEGERWLCGKVSGSWSGDERYFDEILLGDANADGQVNLTDAQQMLQMALRILEQDTERMDRLDMDDDGDITLEDASMVLGCALRMKPQAYCKSLLGDQIYAKVKEREEPGIWVMETTGEAVEFFSRKNMLEEEDWLRQLGAYQTRNKKVLVSVADVNVKDENEIRTASYYKTCNTFFKNTIIQNVALMDDNIYSYVQIYLIDAADDISEQKVSLTADKYVRLHMLDQAVTMEHEVTICSTYAAYCKLLEENNLSGQDGIDETFFENNQLVFTNIDNANIGENVRNTLSLKRQYNGYSIRIRNEMKDWNQVVSRQRTCFMIEVSKDLKLNETEPVQTDFDEYAEAGWAKGNMFTVRRNTDLDGQFQCVTKEMYDNETYLENAAYSLGITEKDEIQKWKNMASTFGLSQYDIVCVRKNLNLPFSFPYTVKMNASGSYVDGTLKIRIHNDPDRTIQGLIGNDVILMISVKKGTVPEHVIVHVEE